MNINRDNYEAWLLDLIEGRLAPEQVQQVRDFLLLNPDCATDLEEIEPWVLEAEALTYSGKSGLKKELPHQDSVASGTNFDLFSIARMEGDLTDRQVEDHQRLIDGDSNRMKEWLGWEKTSLVATPVIFKGKGELKKHKKQKTRVLWISVASAAAAIFLFFAIFTVDQGEHISKELVSLEQDLPSEPALEQKITEKVEKPIKAVEKATQDVKELLKTPASGNTDSGIFSIKKHQDPPELTGKKRETVSTKAKEENLQPGPLRIAMLEKGLLKTPHGASKDRIEPLDLPALTTFSEKSSFQQISEKGLRQSYLDFVEEKDISLLTIASAGIEGINFLAGSELSLNLSRDENGKVSGFRYRGDILSVDTPVKKAE